MLYQQLRPGSLDEIFGNRAVVESLRSVLVQEDKPHVFLFSGPSGCGKTTLARILAKEFGCETIMDMMEINAAQTRGIDTIRWLEGVAAQTAWGKSRMVILDECHALTKAAQNCLLKMLEDVPKHQYYALVSTDPQQIIATIRNRCATYAMSKLRPPDMDKLLQQSVEKLEADVEPEVLQMIRVAADGSPRQALVMLEQVLTMEPEEALDALSSGTITQKGVKELCKELLSETNPKQALKILKSMDDEPEQTRRAVLGYMTAVVTNAKNTRTASCGHKVIKAFLAADTFRSGKPALICAILDCFL